jgi:Transposase DDE domain
MEREELSTLAARFKRVMSEKELNHLGREIRFCRRERLLTPFRLAVSLVGSFALRRVETIADLQRAFNALFETEVAYKPFHNQLAKGQFATFMRELASRMLEALVVKVLEVGREGAFTEFRRIVIQDGSSFAVKDVLARHYPGRFRTVSPAAVELHVTLDLLEESVARVALTPDTAPERDELPAPETLGGALLLADRGYFDREYLAEVSAAAGSFVVRAPVDINPQVLAAYGDTGERLRGWGAQSKLRDGPRLPRRGFADLDVVWHFTGGSLTARVVVSWNAADGEYRYLVTNLPRERYTPAHIASSYRLRWQVELLFKEWKSYANLHAFDTANAGIVEGLIWAAIGAATLKRYLAHATQRVMGVETSTRKTAMCATHVLGDILEALLSGGHRALLATFERAVRYLAVNATRAHPNRDRRTGRLQLGLDPVLGAA